MAANPVVSAVFPPVSGEEMILPLSVHDGDTIHFAWLVMDVARLSGINAPELFGPTAKAGRAATAYLKTLLGTGQVRAVIHGREKFGRALIEIFLPDGRSVSQAMIDAGHTVQWDGKGPRPTAARWP